MGLICPPAIVQSLPKAQVLNLPPGGSCDIIRQWTCSGAWPIFVLTFDHLVSHRNFPSSAPDKCWNLSPVRAPSLVLSETASSASPQNRREVAVHLRICLTCATARHSSFQQTRQSASLHPREAVGMDHCQAPPTRDKQMPRTMMCAESFLPSPWSRDGASDTDSGDPFSKPDMREAMPPFC